MQDGANGTGTKSGDLGEEGDMKVNKAGGNKGGAGVEKRVCAEFLTVRREGVGYIEVSFFRFLGTDGWAVKEPPCPPICLTFLSPRYLPPLLHPQRAGNHKLMVPTSQDALASSPASLTTPERAGLHLSIFFANADPTIHPTYHHVGLLSHLDSIYTHDLISPSFPNIKLLESEGRFREKGVADYIRALENCHATNAPWTVLFEDDILLAEGWLVRVVKGVEDLEKRRKKGKEREWLFMRLFNQERSTGWSSEEIGGNNELLISVGYGWSWYR